MRSSQNSAFLDQTSTSSDTRQDSAPTSSATRKRADIAPSKLPADLSCLKSDSTHRDALITDGVYQSPSANVHVEFGELNIESGNVLMMASQSHAEGDQTSSRMVTSGPVQRLENKIQGCRPNIAIYQPSASSSAVNQSYAETATALSSRQSECNQSQASRVFSTPSALNIGSVSDEDSASIALRRSTASVCTDDGSYNQKMGPSMAAVKSESPARDSQRLPPSSKSYDTPMTVPARRSKKYCRKRKSPPPSSSVHNLVWSDSEITGHDPDDPSDDGYGINGIGFKPTPAMAEKRRLQRRKQMNEWRRREDIERRARRYRARTENFDVPNSDATDQPEGRNHKRVHFAEGGDRETQQVI